MDKLFVKSCENMSEIKDGQVDLVVTSPPYWNAIDYDTHVTDPAAWYRTRKPTPYEHYLEWLGRCFGEVFRTLKPGGFCCVIVGTVLYRGRHYPLPHDVTDVMRRIGYCFHDEIIWHKVTGGVKRAGVTLQNPFPGYYYPNIMTEHILIFRKPGPPIYRNVEQAIREASRITTDEIFVKEIANNVWHIAPVPPGHLPHPCPFPEEIPLRLILLYSHVGDLVLDPFAGIGTTCKVARHLGRRYVGYDIHEKYIEIARKRIDEPLHLRDQLIPVWQKIPIRLRNSNKTLKPGASRSGDTR